MGKRAQIIEGLQIFERYDPDGWCCAEHDIIYSSRAIQGLKPEDHDRLIQLGWFIDKESDSWATFT